MENPKTTVSGIVGALGSLLLAVGVTFQSKPWSQTLMVLGSALSGSSGVGTFFARDASGKPVRQKGHRWKRKRPTPQPQSLNS